MKIIKNEIYTIEISRDELAVIQKIFGKTSPKIRKDRYEFTQEEAELASLIYESIKEELGVLYTPDHE